MEHMCVCGRHSSQIRQNGARAHQTRSECEAQTGLWRKPYHSSVCTHTHSHAHFVHYGDLTPYVQHALNNALPLALDDQ